MSQSSNNPLQYFEELLMFKTYDSLKVSFVNEIKESAGSQFHSLDYEKGIVEVVYNDNGAIGVSTLIFENEFPKEINSKKIGAISDIDNFVFELIKGGTNYIDFLNLLNKNINLLKKKAEEQFSDQPYILASLINIQKHLSEKYEISILDLNTNNQKIIYSFDIQETNEKSKLTIISELYKELTTSPPLISCTEDEFKKAFTGKEVKNGIKWLVTGKNKQYSKPSLFYFLNKLIDNGFLKKEIISDLNKYVLNVFRDNQGEKIKKH